MGKGEARGREARGRFFCFLRDTTVIIKNTLTDDKKGVKTETLYANGAILSNKKFNYDVNGNVTSISTEQEPGQWVATQYEYDQQYKGAYLTR